MSGNKHFLFGKKHTEESKQKMRKPHKKFSDEYKKILQKNRMAEKNPMFGKTQSVSSKEKNKIAHLNKLHTDISKNKMSKARIGKKHTEETKEKMSKWQKGKTYEERFGEKKASEIKEKLRIAKTRKIGK